MISAPAFHHCDLQLLKNSSLFCFQNEEGGSSIPSLKNQPNSMVHMQTMKSSHIESILPNTKKGIP